MYKRQYYNAYKKRASKLSQEKQVAMAKKVLTKLGYHFIWDDFSGGPRNQFGFIYERILGMITERVQAHGFKGATTASVWEAIIQMTKEGAK